MRDQKGHSMSHSCVTLVDMTDDSQKTPGRSLRADAAQRAMRGWNMRVSGVDWDTIADELGYSDTSNAIRAVQNYFGTLPQMEREDVRRLWRQRHEELWRLAHRDAQDGRAGAVRSGVAVARSAAQLDGLDAPTRVEVGPDAEQFERVVAAMVTAQRGGEEAVEVDIVDYEAEIDPGGNDETPTD